MYARPILEDNNVVFKSRFGIFLWAENGGKVYLFLIKLFLKSILDSRENLHHSLTLSFLLLAFPRARLCISGTRRILHRSNINIDLTWQSCAHLWPRGLSRYLNLCACVEYLINVLLTSRGLIARFKLRAVYEYSLSQRGLEAYNSVTCHGSSCKEVQEVD